MIEEGSVQVRMLTEGTIKCPFFMLYKNKAVGYFTVSGIFIPKNRKRRLYDKNKHTAFRRQGSKLGC